jgi:t-SNARE complex subunit (syntaxin)
MAFQQGEKLDVMGENLSKTKDNTVEANKHLEEASKLSASNNRCCVWLIVAVLAALCVIMLIVLLECSFRPLQQK